MPKLKRDVIAEMIARDAKSGALRIKPISTTLPAGSEYRLVGEFTFPKDGPDGSIPVVIILVEDSPYVVVKRALENATAGV